MDIKKRYFLIFSVLLIFSSCEIKEVCYLEKTLINIPFHVNRNIDGSFVFDEDEVSLVFPEVRFADSGLINKSGIGKEIIRYEESSSIKYIIELGTLKNVDFAGGCLIYLFCRTEDGTPFHFQIWKHGDQLDFFTYLSGGLGLSYYGDNLIDFKNALVASEGSENLVGFLNDIIESLPNEGKE
ncbi:MAG: hypothetical protein R2830_05225 [Saprospiraceae bacterium]